jgi:hypothetical protein
MPSTAAAASLPSASSEGVDDARSRATSDMDDDAK